MKGMMGALGLASLTLRLAYGDAGVLVPADRQQPDPAIFSLDEMCIDIQIDNGDARVSMRQIFGSHTSAVTEGSYIFALPSRAHGLRFRGLGRPDAHSGRDPGAAARGGDLREPEAADDRSGPAAAGRARSRRSAPQQPVQRADRADSAVRDQAHRDRISRAVAGGELPLEAGGAVAAGCVSGADRGDAAYRAGDPVAGSAARFSGAEQGVSAADRRKRSEPGAGIVRGPRDSADGGFQRAVGGWIGRMRARSMCWLTGTRPAASRASCRPRRCWRIRKRTNRRALWSRCSTPRSRCNGRSWSGAIGRWTACCIRCGRRTVSTCCCSTRR